MRKDFSEARARMTAQLLATLEEDEIATEERMASVRRQHCSSGRNAEIATRLREMRKSMLSLNSESDKTSRITFVTGESNSGKSTLVEYAIANDPLLSNLKDSGDRKHLICLDAPPASSLRNLGVEIVRSAGYWVKDDIKQTVVWPKVREQLKEREVAFIIIDEAQRLLKIESEVELQNVSDSLISLVDMKEWPIRLVLIGVDPLPVLRERDSQMMNRSKAIELGAVPPGKPDRVTQWIKEIIVDHAQLTLGDVPADDFAKRLIHACDGNVGSIILLIRRAVECAFVAKSDSVTTRHFAQAYHNTTKCAQSENLFEISLWRNTPSGLAKIKEGDASSDSTPKPLPSGERPR